MSVFVRSLACIVCLCLPFLLFAIKDATVIDFGQFDRRIEEAFAGLNAGAVHPNPDGTPGLVPSAEMMRLNNWVVDLRSAGARLQHHADGQCVAVESREQGQTVLGVRINFPTTRQNDRAFIRPPFPLNVYDRQGNFSNLSNGIVPNIGMVRDVSVWVRGRNYPFRLAVRFIDQDNDVQEIFFGNLFFDNWRRLTWVNPNYTDTPRHRVLERRPLYPRDMPFYRFESFVVYRDMEQIGGNFVFYIKDLSMSYDLFAVPEETDIDDEAVWHIIQTRTNETMRREAGRLGELLHDIERGNRLRSDGGSQP